MVELKPIWPKYNLCAATEEGREFILLTVGMAKLLMGQKMQQFRGLCDKNNVSIKILTSMNIEQT